MTPTKSDWSQLGDLTDVTLKCSSGLERLAFSNQRFQTDQAFWKEVCHCCLQDLTLSGVLWPNGGNGKGSLFGVRPKQTRCHGDLGVGPLSLAHMKFFQPGVGSQEPRANVQCLRPSHKPGRSNRWNRASAISGAEYLRWFPQNPQHSGHSYAGLLIPK